MNLAPYPLPSLPQLAALLRLRDHGPMTRHEMRDLVHPGTRKGLDRGFMIELYANGYWDITKRGRRVLELADAG